MGGAPVAGDDRRTELATSRHRRVVVIQGGPVRCDFVRDVACRAGRPLVDRFSTERVLRQVSNSTDKLVFGCPDIESASLIKHLEDCCLHPTVGALSICVRFDIFR